jgi:hypothetical protein
MRLHRYPLALTALLWSVPARAEPLRWVPVFVFETGTDPEPTLALTQRLVSALRTGFSVQIDPPALAAARFDAAHSENPAILSGEQLDRYSERVHRALELAVTAAGPNADQNFMEADVALTEFHALGQNARDYLDQQRNTTRDVFTYCALHAHHLLRAGHDDLAREQMRQCILTMPYQQLSPGYDVAVRTLYEELRAEILATRKASLGVDVVDQQTGCIAVVNGTPKGKVPYREEGLLASKVRVQVNCGRPGRVHRVALGEGHTALVVDPRFEHAVETGDLLSLNYPHSQARARYAVKDAARIGKLLDAEVILLIEPAEGEVRFQHYHVASATLGARVELAQAASDTRVLAASAELVESPTRPAAPSDCTQASAPASRSEHSMRLFGGVALEVAGIGAFTLAWIIHANQLNARGQIESASSPEEVNLGSLQRYLDSRMFALGSGIAGALLTTAGIPVLLKPRDGVPAWSWLAGAGGLLVAGTGVGLWVAGSSCSAESCPSDSLDPTTGQLLLMHAAPLLAIPLTHGIRALTDSESLSVTPEMGWGTGRLAVQGAF